MKINFSFDKSQRLLKSADFRLVKINAFKFRQSGLLFLFKNNRLALSRLGITVTKKALPKAVDRNRVKRLLREAWRLSVTPAGWDVVVIANAEAMQLSFQQVNNSFQQVIACLSKK